MTRGAYYERVESDVAEAMTHALTARDTGIKYRITAIALGKLFGCTTAEARRFVERAHYLIESGEDAFDLMRRMNPNPPHKSGVADDRL